MANVVGAFDSSDLGGADVVGIDFAGNVWVARSTGTQFSPPTVVIPNSAFKTTASDSTNYFTNRYRQRVWVTDVTGDDVADLVGIDGNGNIVLYRNTASGFAPATVSSSPFSPALGWFDPPGSSNTNSATRVWIGDVNGDDVPDFSGVDNWGHAVVALGTRTGFTTSSQVSATGFSNENGWFGGNSQDRLWLADIDGDHRADLVGVGFDGSIFASLALKGAGQVGFGETKVMGRTVFSTSAHWFDTSTHPRIWVKDVSGDGLADIVGIAPKGQGNGDVWVARSTGAGFTSKVWLHDSRFKTGVAEDWFTLASQPRVFLTDVSGDAIADLVGIAASGDIWAATAAHDDGSPAAPLSDRALLPASYSFRPALRTIKSKLREGGANGFFATSKKPRVWFADVARDGISDAIAIAPDTADFRDGDITWTAVLPTSIVDISPVRRGSFDAGLQPRPVSVVFSRPVNCVTSSPDLRIAQTVDGQSQPVTVTKSKASVLASSCLYQTTFSSVASGDVKITKTVEGLSAVDRFGQQIDGNGNGFLDNDSDLSRRIDYIYGGLAAASAKFDLFGFVKPESSMASADPAQRFPAAGGGLRACYLSDMKPFFLDDNPNPTPQARLIVLGRDTGVTVIVSAELVGINPGRVRRLIAARTGIDEQNIIISATHAHSVLRTIDLYTAPGFDDRNFEGYPPPYYDYPSRTNASDPGVYPYVQWLEDTIAAKADEAFGRMVPVTLGVGNGVYRGETIDENRDFGVYNRWAASAGAVVHRICDNNSTTEQCLAVSNGCALGAAGAEFDSRVGVIALRSLDSNEPVALLANYGLHPVVMLGAAEEGGVGVTPDFTGFFSDCLERGGCAADGAPPYPVALFVQAAAGDVDPVGEWTNDWERSQYHGTRLAEVTYQTMGQQGFWDGTAGLNVKSHREIYGFSGISSCDNIQGCALDEPRPDGFNVGWELETTAVVIGTANQTRVAFATIPGEPFSKLAFDLRAANTPAGPERTFLFGYSNGYFGYFPDARALNCSDSMEGTPASCKYTGHGYCNSDGDLVLGGVSVPNRVVSGGYACYSAALCNDGAASYGVGPIFLSRASGTTLSVGEKMIQGAKVFINYLNGL